jgi:hypothetical protein
MKNVILILSFILVLTNTSFCQNSRKPINISNDFYTIKISDGIGKISGSTITTEKNGKDYIKIENASLKTILERVYQNSSLKFTDNTFANQYLTVDLTFQGISLDEFQPLFKQQICTYFPIKILEFKGDSEKWTLQIQDSVLLASKVFSAKLMDVFGKGFKTLETYNDSGKYKIENVSLDEFAKKISKLLKIPVKNNIESKSVYTFELKITNPIDYEDVKKQLEGFGFQIISEKYSNKVIEISSKK